MTIRGEMIWRLALQERKNTVNEANEKIPNPTWSDITKVWAKIKPMSGSEYAQADSQNAKITHEITIWNIRNLTDQISASMRFYDSLKGTVYNITTYRKTMLQADRIIIVQCIEDESRQRLETE
jgi:SPP1 family predicted phage head-tail adaptor